MKPPKIALDEIKELGEPCFRATIPPEWADNNGHMNIRWYLVLLDDAGDIQHEQHGHGLDYHRAHNTGTMDLEQHINYVSEVMPGEQIAIYSRAFAVSPKRYHYLMFLVNESIGKLSAIFECMNAFVDLSIRKTAPWPPEALAIKQALVEKHSQLSWSAPVSGSMRV